MSAVSFYGTEKPLHTSALMIGKPAETTRKVIEKDTTIEKAKKEVELERQGSIIFSFSYHR